MATDHVQTLVRCPACDTRLMLPARARHNGDGTATVTVDSSPVRQHVAEHHRQSLEQQMKRHSVSIVHDGAHGSVTVDGVDLGQACRSATWSAEAGSHPRLELDLLMTDVTEIGSEDTEVLIPEPTAEALVALGWTPPTATGQTGEDTDAPANP